MGGWKAPEALRDVWTAEALEALKSRPEASMDAAVTTETAAWRAGFVAGYVEAKEKAMTHGTFVVDPPLASER